MRLPRVKKFEKYMMFPKTKPWGYHPEAVESKIREYEEALRNVNDKYQEQCNVIATMKSQITRLQEEIKDMHFQMASLELPEAEEAVEDMVLNQFKNYNSTEEDDYEEEPNILNSNHQYNESSSESNQSNNKKSKGGSLKLKINKK